MKPLKVVRKISKQKLVNVFQKAIDSNFYQFVIVEIEAEGIREFIVIPRVSFIEKQSFYARSYTDDLVHVMNKNVKIINYVSVNRLTDEMFI